MMVHIEDNLKDKERPKGKAMWKSEHKFVN